MNTKTSIAATAGKAMATNPAFPFRLASYQIGLIEVAKSANKTPQITSAPAKAIVPMKMATTPNIKIESCG